MVTKKEKFRSGQEAQLNRGASLGAADRELFLAKRRTRRPRRQAEILASGAEPNGPACAPAVRPGGRRAKRRLFETAQRAQLETPVVLSRTDRELISEGRPSRRLRILALQQAQLEAPAVLGKAERVLLGQAQLYQRQRFRANQMAQLSEPSVMGETERMLLIGARSSGWRRPLRALGEAVVASLAYAQAQLKMRRAAGQTERVAAAQGPEVDAGPAETPAAAIASPAEREQGTATDTPAAPPAAEAPTEAARIIAKAFGREDLAGQLSIVTAALTEVGAPKDEFGLVLKVGSLAPKAQAGASEFTVTGMGLAELSHGLSRWLKEVDKTDVPLQVIDDGSGKIKVLIS